MSALASFDGIKCGDRVRIDADLPPHRTGRVDRFKVVTVNHDGSPRWVFAQIVSDHHFTLVEVPTELLAVIP